MHADLEHLISLQQLESRRERAQRAIAEIPDRQLALDQRVDAKRGVVEDAKQRLATCHDARRAIEKDLAALQTRLSQFKDQLMQVKTNKEYQAVLKEIAAASDDIRALEDRVLVRLLEADDLTAEVKRAEQELESEQRLAAEQRQALEQERRQMEEILARSDGDRQRIVDRMPPDLVGRFDHLARTRRGIAVAEARQGHCTVCNVRLRPQIFNDVLRNDTIVQCESCFRILYHQRPDESASHG